MRVLECFTNYLAAVVQTLGSSARPQLSESTLARRMEEKTLYQRFIPKFISGRQLDSLGSSQLTMADDVEGPFGDYL